jgi:hypothetical protein
MGINAYTLDYFWEMMEKAGIGSLKGKWLLELGNQRVRANAFVKYGTRSILSKMYFMPQGCNHHAIDINGLDGAVPLDMDKPIPIKRFINAFDIITDFGFMEHIDNQDQAWKNIDAMGKPGCVYIHSVPLVGMYPGHCKHYYTEEFFEDLCNSFDYKTLDLQTFCTHPSGKRDEVLCTYVKVR